MTRNQLTYSLQVCSFAFPYKETLTVSLRVSNYGMYFLSMLRRLFPRCYRVTQHWTFTVNLKGFPGNVCLCKASWCQHMLCRRQSTFLWVFFFFHSVFVFPFICKPRHHATSKQRMRFPPTPPKVFYQCCISVLFRVKHIELFLPFPCWFSAQQVMTLLYIQPTAINFSRTRISNKTRLHLTHMQEGETKHPAAISEESCSV